MFILVLVYQAQEQKPIYLKSAVCNICDYTHHTHEHPYIKWLD